MIALKYSLFAVIATMVNLLTQAGYFFLTADAAHILMALAFGTATGLVTKYLLDKHYIFGYRAESLKEDSKTFFAYSLVGVFTTMIFWLFELGFDVMFAVDYAKYVGGALGLAIGYYLKYQIDKRLVFVDRGHGHAN
ncbi:MAG: GtrA family protein [Pseudomonadota bacterium]